MHRPCLVEEEWDLLYRACQGACTREEADLRDSLVTSLTRVAPGLAARVRQMDDAQLTELCLALAGRRQTGQQPAAPPPAERVVLVVDDNPATAGGLADFLGQHGYATATASHGQEALAYLRANPPPCLIVLDLLMPVMDGWKFRQAQLEEPRLAGVPLIVCSAAGDAESSPVFRDVLGLYAKPVDPEVVLEHARLCC